MSDTISTTHLSSARPRAAIVGGGIGGLAAAIALRDIGYDTTVFERATPLREVGAGISLWSNAMTALECLGVADAVRERALPDLKGGIYDQRGGRIVTLEQPELAQKFGNYNIMLHRAELHELLLDAVGRPNLRLGATLTGIAPTSDGARAWFEDGSEVEAELIVGADGLHSVVRAQLHGDTKPTYAGYTAWRAIVAFPHEGLLPGESWGAGARFGRVPMSDGRVYWFATRNAPEGVQNDGDAKEELLEVFGSWHDPIRALIRATDEHAILRNDIYDRPPLRSWSRGHITLLGDAAHPMTPNLGQGACQALEDAVVLARCLRNEPTVPAALAAYEAARRQRTSAIVLRSRRIGSVGQWSHPFAVRARDTLFRMMPPAAQAKQLERVLRFEG